MQYQLLLILSLLCSSNLLPVSAEERRPPNIIFILADDYGWGDPQCYGHPYAKTPNLDRLALEGTRFTHFYATGVTCCPARAGLMTGKLPATYAKYPASFGFGNQITISEMLKRHGYATGHFGKWHMGPVTTPGTYGFDVIGSDEAETKKSKNVDGSKDARVFDHAIQFIEKHRAVPFYINVWSHITHHPVNPHQKFVDEFASLKVDETKFSDYQQQKFATVRENGGDVDDAMRRFLGEAFSMDQEIGRLLTKVDELGLREDTIVVFSSDQGPSAPKDVMPTPGKIAKAKAQGKLISPENARVGFNLLGYAGPNSRGGKHTDYEGGVRVPLIVRWPNHAPAGHVDEQSVISGADWLPTLCAITGVKINAAEFDGENAAVAFSGSVFERSKPLFWKVNNDNSDPAMRWRNWKLHGTHRARGEVELYDLANDPGERQNIAEKHPEIVEELSSKLKSWIATLPKTYEHGDLKEN